MYILGFTIKKNWLRQMPQSRPQDTNVALFFYETLPNSFFALLMTSFSNVLAGS
jgi:hypothetical protein